jgi:excisionase family DNA binding protein
MLATQPQPTGGQVHQMQFHSLRDLSEALGMHYMTILGWARAKKIRTVRLPGERKYRIPHDEWNRIMGLPPISRPTTDGTTGQVTVPSVANA